MAMDDVEADQNDFSSQVRWANAWQSIFFALYCMVMLVSLFLFLCLLRAMARHTPKKETPLYFFIVFIFFTGLVEDALIIQQFIMVNVPTAHTTTLCQFFTYVVYGNKILTAISVLSLLFYTWIAVTLKRTVIEQTAKKYFPVFVLGLFLLELVLMIEPTLNVRANASQVSAMTSATRLPISVPLVRAARSMSPVDNCTMPRSCSSMEAWVPLPAPGGPKRIMFIGVLFPRAAWPWPVPCRATSISQSGFRTDAPTGATGPG